MILPVLLKGSPSKEWSIKGQEYQAFSSFASREEDY